MASARRKGGFLPYADDFRRSGVPAPANEKRPDKAGRLKLRD
jgi:hypothetical protein